MGFAVTLLLGPGNPMPVSLMNALDSVEVTQSDRAPNGFQLTFTTPRTAADIPDYAVLAGGSLKPGQRVIIQVTAPTTSPVLIDGFVTHVQLQPPTVTEEARIIVTGEDLSVAMDVYEYSLEYPLLPDSAIAALILEKWSGLGITPSVDLTQGIVTNLFGVTQQAATDRAFLNQLAARNACVFCIQPGQTPGQSTAYWGPPQRTATPQPVLTVDPSAGTVTQLVAEYDGTAATLVYGMVMDTLTDLPLPVLTVGNTRSGTLAADTPLSPVSFSFSVSSVANLASQALSSVEQLVSGVAGTLLGGGGDSISLLNYRLFMHQGMNVLQAYNAAQSITDASADNVSTLKGRLDALRYGGPLLAPGVVTVAGAGTSFDGLWYVQKTTHFISRGAYVQEFALTRDGWQSTLTTVPSSQIGFSAGAT